MSLQAVSFDLDDTLYDYREYARAGLRAAAEHLQESTGEAAHHELRWLYFVSGVTEGTFDRLAARRDLPPGVVDELVEAFHAATTPMSPYDETERVLSQLAEDYELGLVTDGRGGLAKLRRLGIREYFDSVVVTPEVDCSKRQETAFERALDGLTAPAGATAYVGDDPRVDFRVPNEMGMWTVRLRRGRYADLEPTDRLAEPDVEIAELSALPDVVDRATGG